MLALSYLLGLALLPSALAATADQWRSRSIYQLIVDRYALPAGADLTACDPADQTWCGGTWNTVTANLDYIQQMGFTAVWISPVSQNYYGPRTVYGDAYHGYWIADVTQLNTKYGSADDLKALSDELHRRNMYLMVDIVVNNVMGTSTTPDLSTYLFKDQSQYHPFCGIDWGNRTSEMNCWLGDTKVTLPDVNTQDPGVQAAYASWIQQLVQEYSIDGLRIDAAKHVDPTFWPPFCAAAGVFCIGEVDDADATQAAVYQGPLDSVLNYPMYNALVETFTIPGPNNISALADMVNISQQVFSDTGLLGNFLENQDNPRWQNLSVDPLTLNNAMAWNWMSDGIPIVYYGQEQGFAGNTDPFNREPLWPSGYQVTPTYQFIQVLNQLRNFLVTSTDWLNSTTQVLTTTPKGIAVMKGDVISVYTTIGSVPQNISVPVYTPFATNVVTTDVLTCTQYTIGSRGTVQVTYSMLGGAPVILVPNTVLVGSSICAAQVNASLNGAGAINAPQTTSDAPRTRIGSAHVFLLMASVVFGSFLL